MNSSLYSTFIKRSKQALIIYTILLSQILYHFQDYDPKGYSPNIHSFLLEALILLLFLEVFA